MPTRRKDKIPIVNQLPAPPPATIREDAGPSVKFPIPANTFPRTRRVKISQATPPKANVRPMNRPAQRLRIVSLFAPGPPAGPYDSACTGPPGEAGPGLRLDAGVSVGHRGDAKDGITG